MCDKATDGFLSALIFVPDWLVKSQIPEILNEAVFSNDDMNLDYIDSDIIAFFSDHMGNNTIDLSLIILDLMMKIFIMVLKL